MAQTPIGMMRSVVQILQPVVAGGTQTWNTRASIFATPRAFIDTQRGTEQPEAGGPPNLVISDVRIRYRPGVRPRMRILVTAGAEAGRLLEIDSVVNLLSRNEELQLLCREVTS